MTSRDDADRISQPVAAYRRHWLIGRGSAIVGAALLLLSGGLPDRPALAVSKVCGEREQLLERLEQRHDETPRALGLSADGAVVELLVAPDGGWTLLVTYPKKPTCVVAVGEAWQPLTKVGQPA